MPDSENLKICATCFEIPADIHQVDALRCDQAGSAMLQLLQHLTDRNLLPCKPLGPRKHLLVTCHCPDY